jgi:hypothetical protein
MTKTSVPVDVSSLAMEVDRCVVGPMRVIGIGSRGRLHVAGV